MFELDMDREFARTSKDPLERDVPVYRLENDAELREIYEFGRKLGQGSFGVVYEATHIETQTKWAIKEVCRAAAGSSKSKMLVRETNILKQVNHAHIIHLQAIYHSTTMIYLVTELCKGGELKQLLKRKKFFTEDETRNIICSLADAVVYLHKKDIIHRDLKLENILVKNSPDEDDGRINIKVTDFGLSVKTGGVGIGSLMTEACGTLIYMAPEVMSLRGYSQWCDVWSIGVVMYMLLCGEAPFHSATKAGLFEKIKKGEINFTQPIWATVSDTAKNVLIHLLKVDPAYRMSASQLLETPWITGDTNVPAVPSNVLEMMRHHLEQEQMRRQSPEFSSLTSSEDTLDPNPAVPQLVSTETDTNGTSLAKLSLKSNDGTRTPSNAIKLDHGVKAKESGCSSQQDKHVNSSDTSRHSPITQSHAGVKPTSQPCAKQRRPQDRKDLGTAQKAGPNVTKADDNRPSTSSKVGLAPVTHQLPPRPAQIPSKTKK